MCVHVFVCLCMYVCVCMFACVCDCVCRWSTAHARLASSRVRCLARLLYSTFSPNVLPDFVVLFFNIFDVSCSALFRGTGKSHAARSGFSGGVVALPELQHAVQFECGAHGSLQRLGNHGWLRCGRNRRG